MVLRSHRITSSDTYERPTSSRSKRVHPEAQPVACANAPTSEPKSAAGTFGSQCDVGDAGQADNDVHVRDEGGASSPYYEGGTWQSLHGDNFWGDYQIKNDRLDSAFRHKNSQFEGTRQDERGHFGAEPMITNAGSGNAMSEQPVTNEDSEGDDPSTPQAMSSGKSDDNEPNTVARMVKVLSGLFTAKTRCNGKPGADVDGGHDDAGNGDNDRGGGDERRNVAAAERSQSGAVNDGRWQGLVADFYADSCTQATFGATHMRGLGQMMQGEASHLAGGSTVVGESEYQRAGRAPSTVRTDSQPPIIAPIGVNADSQSATRQSITLTQADDQSNPVLETQDTLSVPLGEYFTEQCQDSKRQWDTRTEAGGQSQHPESPVQHTMEVAHGEYFTELHRASQRQRPEVPTMCGTSSQPGQDHGAIQSGAEPGSQFAIGMQIANEAAQPDPTQHTIGVSPGEYFTEQLPTSQSHRPQMNLVERVNSSAPEWSSNKLRGPELGHGACVAKWPLTNQPDLAVPHHVAMDVDQLGCGNGPTALVLLPSSLGRKEVVWMLPTLRKTVNTK